MNEPRQLAGLRMAVPSSPTDTMLEHAEGHWGEWLESMSACSFGPVMRPS